MLILEVNNASRGAKDAAGEKWVQIPAACGNEVFVSERLLNIVDFDVFLVDSLRTEEVPDPRRPIHQEIMDRVNAGACLVYFLTTRASWIHPNLTFLDRTGGQVRPGEDDTELDRLMARHAHSASFTLLPMVAGFGWDVFAYAKDGNPVAAGTEFGQGLVILLPEFDDRARVVRDLLDRVLPTMLPDLYEEEGPHEDGPTWLSGHVVPGVLEAKERVAAISLQMNLLEEEAGRLGERTRDLQEYLLLLWADGTPLEKAVRKALTLLGIPTEPTSKGDYKDLVWIGPNDERAFIEIEGNKGAIGEKKGRQLLHAIADADVEYPSSIAGVLLGNPWRHVPVPDRNGPMFSDPLQKMAATHGWKLITTPQVFDWVSRHLQGDLSVDEEARAALGIPEH